MPLVYPVKERQTQSQPVPASAQLQCRLTELEILLAHTVAPPGLAPGGTE